MDYKTLSIIIPVYNEEKTIHLILNKIKEVQLINGLNKEIVMVDDSSTDNSWEKLEKYKEITGNDAYQPSEMLINLAKNGQKLAEAPQKDRRKDKLGFEMSSVANNF